VLTFVVVLLLSIGTAAAHQFWNVASKPTSTSSVLTASKGKAPEALLWLNPFVADIDMICATAPDSYHLTCDYISTVTGRPYFGTPTTQPGITEPGFPVPFPGGVIDDVGVNKGAVAVPDCPPNARCGLPGTGVQEAIVAFGFPRDTFWPKSALAFVVLGVALTLVSAQLVSPTRRLRLPRPHLLRRGNRMASPASDGPPAETVETAAVEVETVEAVKVETSK
jgi:hypothetical protein